MECWEALLWPEVEAYHVLSAISELDATWKTLFFSFLPSPSQGFLLSTWPYFRVSLGLDVWLISDVALWHDFLKSFPTAAHVAIRHWARSFTIGQCCHIWHRHCTRSFMRETCCLKQIRWCPIHCLYLLYLPPSVIKLNHNTKPVSLTAFSVILTGETKPCLSFLTPLPSRSVDKLRKWKEPQWTCGVGNKSYQVGGVDTGRNNWNLGTFWGWGRNPVQEKLHGSTLENIPSNGGRGVWTCNQARPLVEELGQQPSHKNLRPITCLASRVVWDQSLAESSSKRLERLHPATDGAKTCSQTLNRA